MTNTFSNGTSNCDTETSITITVNPDPAVNNDVTDVFCADDLGTTIDLTAYESQVSAGNTFTWYSDDTYSTEVPSPAAATINKPDYMHNAPPEDWRSSRRFSIAASKGSEEVC